MVSIPARGPALSEIKSTVETAVNGTPSPPPPSSCVKPTLVLTLTDTSPANPARVPVTAMATSNNVGARIISETLTITSPTKTRSYQMPIPHVVDMSEFVGEAVTVTYDAADDCEGATAGDQQSASMTVPSFAAEYTVDLGTAVGGNNYHDIQAAINAMVNGSRLTIHPGAHTLYDGGNNPGRLTFSTKQDICITGSAPTVTIDGNQSAATSNNAWIAGSSQRCVLRNIRITNAKWSGMGISAAAVDFTLINVDLDGNDKIGSQVEAATRTTYINCTAQNTTASVDSGIGFYVDNGATDTAFYGCTSQNNAQDGYVTFTNAGHLKILGGLVSGNNRSGIITLGSIDVVIDGVEVTLNNAAGIQIENDTEKFIIRACKVWRNQVHGSGYSGEAAIWCDDSVIGVIECNDVFENWVGIRIDGDKSHASLDRVAAATGTYNTSQQVIVRRNKVYKCGQNPADVAPGGELGAAHFVNCDDVYFHNNTFYNNGRSASGGIRYNGVYCNNDTHSSLPTPTTTDVAWKNNIVHTVVSGPTEARMLWLDRGGLEASDWDYNYWYNPPVTNGFEYGSTLMEFATYQANAAPNEANSSDNDPDINTTTLKPNSSSPVLSAGAKLTTISNISSNVITLAQPRWFHEPIAGQQDTVVFDNGETAKITAVTDTTITVDVVPSGVAIGQGVTSPGCENIGISA